MLIIWLQGIWLPLHGYDFERHAAVGRHLPAAADGRLPRRRPAVRCAVRPVRRADVRHRRAAAGRRATFVGLMLLPVDFQLLGLRRRCSSLNGIGSGPVLGAEHDRDHEQRPGQRSAAPPPACAATFFNAGIVAVDRHLLLADDRRAGRDPAGHAAPRAAPRTACRRPSRTRSANAPPVGSLFAAFLGYNPVADAGRADRALSTLPAADRATLTGQRVLPAPDLAAVPPRPGDRRSARRSRCR